MYQKYNTEAIVLGSREQGESDRIFALYTKDFGLVRARASAVRKETSRMRYALQSYSHAHVSLVRGKQGWRVGGAVAGKEKIQTENLAVFARIASLVLRLVAGEGQNSYVFATLVEAHAALSSSTKGSSATIELVCVARILYGLGYLSEEALSTTLFAHTSYALEHVREAETLREKLLATVNRAINETHL
jgi:DNA repair protein RecO